MPTEFTFEEAKQTFSFEDAQRKQEEMTLGRAARLSGELVVGGGEALLNLGTSMAAQVPAGLAGLGALAIGHDDPAGVVENVSSALTYEPRTEQGKGAADVVQLPFEKLAEATRGIGNRIQAQRESLIPRDLPPDVRANLLANGAIIPTAIETGTNAALMAAPFARGRRAPAEVVEQPAKVAEQVVAKTDRPTEFTFEEATAATPDHVLQPTERTTGAGTDFGTVLDKINEPKDVQAVLQNTIALNEPRIEGARRGTISNVETESAAKLLMTDPKRLEALMKRKTGDALNAESLSAMSSVLKQATKEMHESAVRAKETGSPQDLMAFQKNMEAYTAVAEQFMGARAEAGRALQIFSREMQAANIDGILERFGGVDSIKKKAEILARAETPEQIAKVTKELRQAKTSDVLLEIWINSLLSGPLTHATNVMSNTLVPILTTTEQAVAGAIGKLHGGEKVYLREAATKGYGMIEGAREGLLAAVESFKNEGTVVTPSGKVEAGRAKSISADSLGIENKVAGAAVDVAGKAVRIPGRFLAAEDEFFKAVGYRQELNALAVRQGMSEGLRGAELAKRIEEIKADPPDAMRKRAWDQADEQTFNRELGATGKAIQGIATRHPTARIVAPFIRTPINIVKFAQKRSPLAVLMKEGFWEEYKAGGARRDLALARVGVGSSIGAMTIYYASQGLLTGGGPSDPREKAMQYQTGWKPYSIKIGDNYYAYSRLEPMGMLLGVSADAAAVWDQMDKDDQAEYAALITKSISSNLTSKTWLKGMSDAVQAFSDPDRYGEKWVLNYAGTVVPSAVAQVARVQDPYLRRAENLVDKVKSRIPGLSEELPPRLNLWGEPIKLEGSLGPDMLSPIYISSDTNDKVSQEMVRLKMAPSPVDKKINKVELTPEQHNEYIRFAGEPAKDQLDRLVYSDAWERIPDFKKKELIDGVISRNRKLATMRMVSRYPQELMINPTKKKIAEMRESVENAR